MALIDAPTRAEKLRPPRALTAIGASLYADPAAGSRRAWMAWWSGDPAELRAMIERGRAVGATLLVAGGPPGNYVESGVDAADETRLAALRAAGFTVAAEHVDLAVRTDAVQRTVAGVALAPAGDALVAAVAAAFGDAWAWEASRALAHGGLFGAHDDHGAWLGFAAHSGNLAHRGTFGPIGVLPAARGRGVGAALAAHVFGELRARGHETVTVPWVAPETARFYESLATIITRQRRLTVQRDLSTGSLP